MRYPPAVAVARFATDRAARLGEEPGFTVVELDGENTVAIPANTGGILAFLQVDGESESVLQILMPDDLFRSFRINRPYFAKANRIAFVTYSFAGGFDLWRTMLGKRFSLFAQLTEKYDAPQIDWASMPEGPLAFEEGPQGISTSEPAASIRVSLGFREMKQAIIMKAVPIP